MAAESLAPSLLALSTELARGAGALLRDWLGTVSLVATKSSLTDAVTEADHASEALILEAIRRDRPEDGIIAEEGGRAESRTGITWLIDPLDGTVNYLYGHPGGWAVSIATRDREGLLHRGGLRRLGATNCSLPPGAVVPHSTGGRSRCPR